MFFQRLTPRLASRPLLAGALFFILTLNACTWMSPGMAGFFEGEELVKMDEARQSLRTAILINVAVCPAHELAAYYALEDHLSREVRRPFYELKKVEQCSLVLMMTPCTPQAQTDSIYLVNLYIAVIRSCSLN